MNKLVSNKTILNVFIGLTFLFVLGCLTIMILSLFKGASMIENLFVQGFIITSSVLFYVVGTIHNYKTNKIEKVIRLKKYKWIIWIISIISFALLIYPCYQVFYKLHNTMFPQAIGMDHAAYWFANVPFIYLSGFAIILIILANLILLFIPSENQ